MIRLALLGCGQHSRSSHAAPLARYAARHPGEIELVATCDLNLDRARDFCREFGFARAYSDVETMLTTERVDGCVCVMPMKRIVELAVMLLERKIPCVIEKPLGISPEESERLAGVTRQTGTPHMVSVNRRFMPYLNQAKSWAEDNSRFLTSGGEAVKQESCTRRQEVVGLLHGESYEDVLVPFVCLCSGCLCRFAQLRTRSRSWR